MLILKQTTGNAASPVIIFKVTAGYRVQGTGLKASLYKVLFQKCVPLLPETGCINLVQLN